MTDSLSPTVSNSGTQNKTSVHAAGVSRRSLASPSSVSNLAATIVIGNKSENHWLRNRSLRSSTKMRNLTKISGHNNVDDLLGTPLSSSSARNSHHSLHSLSESTSSPSQRSNSIQQKFAQSTLHQEQQEEQTRTPSKFGSSSKHDDDRNKPFFPLPSLFARASSHDKRHQASKGTSANFDVDDHDFDTRTVDSFNIDDEIQNDSICNSAFSSSRTPSVSNPENNTMSDFAHDFDDLMDSFANFSPKKYSNDERKLPSIDFMSDLAQNNFDEFSTFSPIKATDWDRPTKEENDVTLDRNSGSSRHRLKSLLSNKSLMAQLEKLDEKSQKDSIQDQKSIQKRRGSAYSSTPTEATTSTESMYSLEIKQNERSNQKRRDDGCIIDPLNQNDATINNVLMNVLEKNLETFMNRTDDFNEESTQEVSIQSRRFSLGDYLGSSKPFKNIEDHPSSSSAHNQTIAGGSLRLPPPKNDRDELGISQRRSEHRQRQQRQQEEATTKILNESFTALRYSYSNEDKKVKSTKSLENHKETDTSGRSKSAPRQHRSQSRGASRSGSRSRSKSRGPTSRNIEAKDEKKPSAITEARRRSSSKRGNKTRRQTSNNSDDLGESMRSLSRRRETANRNETNAETVISDKAQLRMTRRLSNEETSTHKSGLRKSMELFEYLSKSVPRLRVVKDEGTPDNLDANATKKKMTDIPAPRRKTATNLLRKNATPSRRSSRKKLEDGKLESHSVVVAPKTSTNTNTQTYPSSPSVRRKRMIKKSDFDSGSQIVRGQTISTKQLLEEVAMSTSLPAVSSTRRRTVRRLVVPNTVNEQESSKNIGAVSSDTCKDDKMSSSGPSALSSRRRSTRRLHNVDNIEENGTSTPQEIEERNRQTIEPTDEEENGEDNGMSCTLTGSMSTSSRGRMTRRSYVNNKMDENLDSKVQIVEEIAMSCSLPAVSSRRRMSRRSVNDEKKDQVPSSNNRNEYQASISSDLCVNDDVLMGNKNSRSGVREIVLHGINSRRTSCSSDEYNSTEENGMSGSLPRGDRVRGRKPVDENGIAAGALMDSEKVSEGHIASSDERLPASSRRNLKLFKTSSSGDEYTSAEDSAMSSSNRPASSRRPMSRQHLQKDKNNKDSLPKTKSGPKEIHVSVTDPHNQGLVKGISSADDALSISLPAMSSVRRMTAIRVSNVDDIQNATKTQSRPRRQTECKNNIVHDVLKNEPQSVGAWNRTANPSTLSPKDDAKARHEIAMKSQRRVRSTSSPASPDRANRTDRKLLTIDAICTLTSNLDLLGSDGTEQQLHRNLSDLLDDEEDIDIIFNEMEKKSIDAVRSRRLPVSPQRRLKRSTQGDSVRLNVLDILDLDFEGN